MNLEDIIVERFREVYEEERKKRYSIDFIQLLDKNESGDFSGDLVCEVEDPKKLYSPNQHSSDSDTILEVIEDNISNTSSEASGDDTFDLGCLFSRMKNSTGDPFIERFDDEPNLPFVNIESPRRPRISPSMSKNLYTLQETSESSVDSGMDVTSSACIISPSHSVKENSTSPDNGTRSIYFSSSSSPTNDYSVDDLVSNIRREHELMRGELALQEEIVRVNEESRSQNTLLGNIYRKAMRTKSPPEDSVNEDNDTLTRETIQDYIFDIEEKPQRSASVKRLNADFSLTIDDDPEDIEPESEPYYSVPLKSKHMNNIQESQPLNNLNSTTNMVISNHLTTDDIGMCGIPNHDITNNIVGPLMAHIKPNKKDTNMKKHSGHQDTNTKTLPVPPKRTYIGGMKRTPAIIAKFMVNPIDEECRGVYDNKKRYCSRKEVRERIPRHYSHMDEKMQGIRIHITACARRYLIVNADKQATGRRQSNYIRMPHYLDWEQAPPPNEEYDYSLHYFREDPEKRIDYILVFKEVLEDEELAETTPIQRTGRELDAKKKRRIFEENLERKGLSIERETYDKNEGNDIKRVVYVKVHASDEVLFEYAEHLQLKKLLKIDPMKIFRDEYKEDRSWTDWKLFSSLHAGERFYKDEIWDEMKNHKISARFEQKKADRFVNFDEPGFFTTSERSFITAYVLQETPFLDESQQVAAKGDVGIAYLLQEDVYISWFQLHDGPFELPRVDNKPDDEKIFLNDRQVMSMFWADWGRWYKYQPLNRVRIYFGDTVAMYFAWLGFYTKLLIFPAIVGTLVFIYDIYTIFYSDVIDSICDEHFKHNQTHVMVCPECDECDITLMSSYCVIFMIANAFNNGGSVFFAVFISFWSAFFLEFWKRYQITLAFLWSKADFKEEQETARPEYAVTCEDDDVRYNPITLRWEPYREQSILKTLTAISVVIITVVVVIITLISIIIYKIFVYSIFQHVSNGEFKTYASTISSVSGSILQLIAITILSQVYAWLALKITLWENYRTETEFQNNLTVKRFIFEFFNYYGSCFYIAFIKGNFSGYPGHYTRIFGLRLDSCGPGGCLGELAENLAIIFLGKQILNNIQELFIPAVMSWWSRRKYTRYSGDGDKEAITIALSTPWESDNDLAVQENLFPEYLEMVIQYGFATMFVVAFPIAPLFALLNNIVEIRLDAKKYVEMFRRPISVNCMSIGIWFTILDYMASIAIVTNAFVIAFTSDFISQILWEYNHEDDLHTYVAGHLSTAPGNTTDSDCKYWDYRDPDGGTTLWWWKLKAVQFIFVVIFEHFVFTIVRLIDLLIPDVPEKLEALIHLEDSFAREMMKEVIEIDLEKLEDMRKRIMLKRKQRAKYT